MQRFSAVENLRISKAFLALMEERDILWPFHKVELHAEKSRGQLVPLPSFYTLTNHSLAKASVLT